MAKAELSAFHPIERVPSQPPQPSKNGQPVTVDLFIPLIGETKTSQVAVRPGRSVSMILRWQDPEYREKQKKKKLSPKGLEIQRVKARERWKRPDYRAKMLEAAKRRIPMLGKSPTEEHRRKLSEAQKRSWDRTPQRRIRAREALLRRMSNQHDTKKERLIKLINDRGQLSAGGMDLLKRAIPQSSRIQRID